MEQASLAGIQHRAGGNVDLAPPRNIPCTCKYKGSLINVPGSVRRMRSGQGDRSVSRFGKRGGTAQAGIPDSPRVFRIGGVQSQRRSGEGGGTSVAAGSVPGQSQGTPVQRDGYSFIKKAGGTDAAAHGKRGTGLEQGIAAVDPVRGVAVQQPRSGVSPGGVAAVPCIVRGTGKGKRNATGEDSE